MVEESRFPRFGLFNVRGLLPDGTAVASSSFGIKLLNMESGKDIVKLPDIPNTVASIAFSPDGKTLVSGTVEDGEIKLWDTATGQEKRTLRGYFFQYEGQESSRRYGP